MEEKSEESKGELKVISKIVVGEVLLEASESLDVLCDYMRVLLKDESVRKYLEIVKEKKLNGKLSYTS